MAEYRFWWPGVNV